MPLFSNEHPSCLAVRSVCMYSVHFPEIAYQQEKEPLRVRLRELESQLVLPLYLSVVISFNLHQFKVERRFLLRQNKLHMENYDVS